MSDYSDTAVIIPCYNEAIAIRRVVRDFCRHLPGAQIHVFDNDSTDNTSELAALEGAVVHLVRHRGKGNVVSRMFADVEAGIYLMADGDGTYPAGQAPALVEAVRSGADMAVGVRRATRRECYRGGHRFGNRLLTGLVNAVFEPPVTDMLSGYRAFSRRFAKSFPAKSTRFEIETELTVYALEQRLQVSEVPIPYLPREEGSTSKLSTYKDGIRILLAILYLVKEAKPFLFFSAVSVLLGVTSVCLGVPVVREFMTTGLVPRFPTAILASALGVISCIMFCIGIILDSVSAFRRQQCRQALLLCTPWKGTGGGKDFTGLQAKAG
jgi:glycosyltransferase involved in cell wall biosynthesis